MSKFIFRGKPFHIALAGLMLGLVVVFYLSLASVTLYLGGQRDLKTADDMVQRVGKELSGVFASEIRPIESAVIVLAETSLVTARNHEERLAQFATMAAALKQNPSAGSVYVGTPGGSFVLMRNLKDRPLDRATFQAPAEAMFLIQSVNRDKGQALGRYYFYDASLALIKTVDKPDYQFDPRNRPWYEQAKVPGRVVQTEPYVFASNQKLGITLAASNSSQAGVVGMDLSLTGFSRFLGRQKVTQSAELVVFGASGTVLAYRDAQKIFKKNAAGKNELVSVPELAVPALTALYQHWKNKPHGDAALDLESQIQVDGADWHYRVEPILGSGGEPLYLGIAMPNAELMADSIRLGRLSAMICLGLLILMLPAVFYASKKVSHPIRDLDKVACAIERFDFSGPDPSRSSIVEVDNLALSMTSMKHTLKRFLDISSALSAESNFHRLIGLILRETISVANATGGSLVLLGTDRRSVETAAWQIKGVEQNVALLEKHSLDESASGPLEVKAIAQGLLQSLRISRSDPQQKAVYAAVFDAFDVDHVHMIALPLRNRAREVIGALVLSLDAAADASVDPISKAHLAFIEALSGTAAIAIDNQKLLQEQKALLDGLIPLIAGAIDAKSAYSGGHCQRVPELTKMLAKAACDKTDGPFADFALSEEGWETLHIAGWLHDCGKVTTPEFVVDKATKLETIYDRIHEVRMRFEVLKRDVEIAAYRQALGKLAPGSVDIDALRAEMAAPLAALDDDFAFIATCNIGGEFMAPDKIVRLNEIAQRRWLRTLDDRLGISYLELLRREELPAEPLPVWESLLSDKPEHIFPRAERDLIDTDNPWGFKIPAPAHLYNRGEVYNLAIARGTLNAEERYKINEHIVQTIKMLSALPFPKHLSRVTEIAGGHHEKMDGTGYPRRLSKDAMSIEARMIAIADVFEALTAVDRPYKKGKTLSESVGIMGLMKKDQHIDPELFELFLESGAYLEYAHRFMRPEQIDAVDVASYVTQTERRVS